MLQGSTMTGGHPAVAAPLFSAAPVGAHGRAPLQKRIMRNIPIRHTKNFRRTYCFSGNDLQILSEQLIVKLNGSRLPGTNFCSI